MRTSCVAVFTLCFSFLAFAQTSPTDPNAPTSSPPASQDASRPETQTPPDTKAPPPTAQASPTADSNRTQSNSQPRYLLAGTDVRASLDTPLSTRTSKVGDRFTATINYLVHDSSGNVVVPVGAKLNGQIGEPDGKIAGAIKDMGHLNLRFTDIQLPDGSDVPLNVALISIHSGRPAPSSASGKTPQIGSSAIAGNAGSVAALGRPIRGLAVGNLAGGGYVLSTTSKQVELPAECVLRLRVERNTPLP